MHMYIIHYPEVTQSADRRWFPREECSLIARDARVPWRQTVPLLALHFHFCTVVYREQACVVTHVCYWSRPPRTLVWNVGTPRVSLSALLCHCFASKTFQSYSYRLHGTNSDVGSSLEISMTRPHQSSQPSLSILFTFLPPFSNHTLIFVYR